jgi:hypothetical protein
MQQVISMLGRSEFPLLKGFAAQSLVTPNLRRPPNGGIWRHL